MLRYALRPTPYALRPTPYALRLTRLASTSTDATGLHPEAIRRYPPPQYPCSTDLQPVPRYRVSEWLLRSSSSPEDGSELK
jgi:hypothetical protein